MRNSEKQWGQTQIKNVIGDYWQRRGDVDEMVNSMETVAEFGISSRDVSTFKKKMDRA